MRETITEARRRNRFTHASEARSPSTSRPAQQRMSAGRAGRHRRGSPVLTIVRGALVVLYSR
ncbi:hypothetical protein C9J85_06705 [Haloferax sp. wsp5]|nr:hypothetical protein C9J85_06705 [Haloferax sp. wsp5]